MYEVCPPDENMNYWRISKRTSDGGIVIGGGLTQEQATEAVDRSWQQREDFLAKSDPERLEILLAQKELLQRDMNEAIHIIGRLVLEMYQWRPSISLKR